ncbi:hypothetical protein AVEN_106517-1 [Araneus ventricosus]|uniref:Uncharacterized protein n=1 Tax=Araneus ventricosus TaxID=182803 RepID=A0A4Y2T3J4_ARAVE|nr:hypothetical protein AVEN_106517-1 [Araneus ventricosus]
MLPLHVHLNRLQRITKSLETVTWNGGIYVYLGPVLKQNEDYLGTDLVILNHCQMTRTTSDLALPSSYFCTSWRTSGHPTEVINSTGLHALRILQRNRSSKLEPSVPALILEDWWTG